MNPRYPSPNNPSFPFNPLNPNPNPNPNVNLNFPFFPNPQFKSCAPPPPPPPPPIQTPLPDLPTSLSSLQSLLNLSRSTLDSLSSLVPPLSLSSKSKSLAQCPFNPHHWVPPNSLFLHTLHCPALLDTGPVLDTLQYPKTLKSEQQLIQQNKFVQPLQDPNAELCFSLDDYVDFNSNFFYHDCPGVVSSLNYDDATHSRIFSLPGFLSVECANFVSNHDREMDGFGGNCVKVLPSEIWAVGCEVERWSDYPNEYPYSVLKALLCLESVNEFDVSMWIIMNSPRFGVVVDVSMRDHMLVLCRLCLKAMAREAAQSFSSLFNSVVDNGGQLNPKSLSFKCPVLVEVLKWLSSQLSILYGQTNAKSLAISMLKHLLPNAAQASLFPLDKDMDQISSSGEDTDSFRAQPSGKAIENEGAIKEDERIFSTAVYVYQIAAAIAALHERSLLEERIKALRMPPPLTAYQRSAEHAYLSKKADEERQKRPNYKPLISHDSLASQRQHDQESNKAKTREELLAEERDYKRRRMSYRGKKLKRTTKEVMRDIIEGYMESIKQAGGIGCLTQGDGGEISTFKASAAHDVINFNSHHNPSSDQRDGYRNPHEYNFRETRPFNATPSRKERQEKDHYSHKYFEDRRTTSRDRRDGDYHSRSPSRDRREGDYHSRSPSRDRQNRDYHSRSPSRDRQNRDYHSRSPGRNRRHDRTRESRNHGLMMNEDERSKSNNSKSSSLSISSGRKDKRKLESTDRHRQQRRDHKSESFRRGQLNDRYDPAEVCDNYDDQFEDSKYTRPES